MKLQADNKGDNSKFNDEKIIHQGFTSQDIAINGNEL